MCHTYSRINVTNWYLFFFSLLLLLWCRLFVLYIVISIHPFTSYIYRLLWWVLFSAFFAFCVMSEMRSFLSTQAYSYIFVQFHNFIDVRSALIRQFFILLWHKFCLMNCNTMVCANEYWKLQLTMLIDQLKIWLRYWVYYRFFFVGIVHPLGIDGMHLQKKRFPLVNIFLYKMDGNGVFDFLNYLNGAVRTHINIQ